MRQGWETRTPVSAGHTILTPTQPVGNGRPQRESNPGPPHHESRALPTELMKIQMSYLYLVLLGVNRVTNFEHLKC